MTILRLILGDQLNAAHPWFRECRDDAVYVMMEVRGETDIVRHHAQKVLGIFAAMRRFADALRQAGHRVVYISLSDPRNRGTLAETLRALGEDLQADRLQRMQADEYRVEQDLMGLCAPEDVVSAHHFLCDREELAGRFATKVPRMEFFYRDMRKRFGVLLQPDGSPEGGQWNFDHDNREKWPGHPQAWIWPKLSTDLGDLWDEIQAAGVQTLGEASARNFPWPLTRRQARQWLAAFLDGGLRHFGRFQDTMSRSSATLFHSGLSFALNLKMLHPMEVIDAAVARWRDGQADLASVEGFVRQILGWREFVRGVYWARMPGYQHLNVLGGDRPLPPWYWTGKTDMACLAHAIGQSLAQGYAHHIQRLMVTGNFALLAGCDPDEVDCWYLGIYVDAFHWVELPNTRGMSQFADGGVVGSKPYAGAAAYMRRQGDYCDRCSYDAKRRQGVGSCPLNSLYWHFHARHADRFRGNPRLAMTYRTWDRMAEDERRAILAQAEHYLKVLWD